MSLVAILVGSRTAESPPRHLAEFAIEQLAEAGHETFLADMSAVPAGVLIDGATTDPSVNDLVTMVDSVDAVIVVTAVVKQVYSGTAKLVLDLLPESAIRMKPVLVLSTGDTAPQQVSDLSATLTGMGAHHVGPDVNVSEYDITRHTCSTALEETAEIAVQQSLSRLLQFLGERPLESAPIPDEVLVEPEAALSAFRRGAILLDVRARPTEGVGLISGALYVRKDDIELVFSPARMQRLLAVDGPEIVVFCNSEHGSRRPVRQLLDLGYEAVSHVRGGAPALRAVTRRGASKFPGQGQ